jgi:CDP-diacylglycerol--glycerol-3-phosphate 3-phosphatidyltransferase
VTLPNALTTARAFLVIPVIGLIAVGDTSAALLVFLGAAVTDALDGALARRRGSTTALGASLDPLADKILVVGTLAALALRGLAPAWAVVLIFARELIAIELRARAPGAVGASLDGKAKTVLQVAAIAALLASAASPVATGLAPAANALLLAATALTVLSGVRLVLRAKQTTADPA